MARSNYSKDEKLVILSLHHKGQQTISELATIFQVSYRTIEEWNYKYEIDGEIGLEEAHMLLKMLHIPYCFVYLSYYFV